MTTTADGPTWQTTNEGTHECHWQLALVLPPDFIFVRCSQLIPEFVELIF